MYIYEWWVDNCIRWEQNRIKPFYISSKWKIKEYIYKCDCIAGNGQRNYALTKITNPDTLLYYLDDDNTIHPDLYNLLDFLENNTIYSFNQYNRINGNNKERHVYIDQDLCYYIFYNKFVFKEFYFL
jgi:hypothetical protein